MICPICKKDTYYIEINSDRFIYDEFCDYCGFMWRSDTRSSTIEDYIKYIEFLNKQILSIQSKITEIICAHLGKEQRVFFAISGTRNIIPKVIEKLREDA